MRSVGVGGAMTADDGLEAVAATELEPVIRAMIDATNLEDRASLLEAFAGEALLIDFGRSFAGREEIGRWSDQENIGTHNRISITGATRRDAVTSVAVEVSGQGYNGPGTLHFTVEGAQITRLEITV